MGDAEQISNPLYEKLDEWFTAHEDTFRTIGDAAPPLHDQGVCPGCGQRAPLPMMLFGLASDPARVGSVRACRSCLEDFAARLPREQHLSADDLYARLARVAQRTLSTQ